MSATSATTDDLDRRFPRRLLIGAAGASALASTGALARPASAAPPTTAWKLGGNADVASDGSNFIGPTNVAPLIFKTRRTSAGPVLERMRLTTKGRLAIGRDRADGQLDVSTDGQIAIAAVNHQEFTSSVGVFAFADVGSGVFGFTTTGDGVHGEASSTTSGIGVQGLGGFAGVRGEAVQLGGWFLGDTGMYASGGTIGAHAQGDSFGLTTASDQTGVFGSARVNGVVGAGGEVGVRATTSPEDPDATVYGVLASTPIGGPGSYAVFAEGDTNATGTATSAAAAYRIDHPLAPDDKWLSHATVNSPDMLNVYSGKATLNGAGEAAVQLPAYFSALNRNVRYQLTPIGSFAPVYIAEQVHDNRFRIAGGTAGLVVSWQVTGVRRDDYASDHPVVPVTPKSKALRGTRQFVARGSRAIRQRIGSELQTPRVRSPRMPAKRPGMPPIRLS